MNGGGYSYGRVGYKRIVNTNKPISSCNVATNISIKQ